MRIVGFCLKLVGGLALAALVAGLFGWIVQHLWNWLMPALFHLPTVTFWQAAGLVLLSRLLFGNIGGGHHGKGWKKRHRRWHEQMRRCKPGKPSAFAPGGDIANWEHFDEWWEQEGESRFGSACCGTGGWGWWKWWKNDGRAEYERWLDKRGGATTGASASAE
jgi:hypothetical protein